MKKILFLMVTMSMLILAKDIDTKEVLKNLDNSNWVIVDTRDTNEYNGWDLSNLGVNGHIKGATDFSYKWLDKENLSESNKKILKERVLEKNIKADKNIILYNTNKEKSEIVANYFRNLGIKNIYFYNLNSSEDYKLLPFESYQNYEMLVPASWVKDALNKKKAKVYEVSWGNLANAAIYLAGHIPEAPHINTDSIEPPPKWMLNTDENLIKFAESMGISKDDTIILYGDNVMASYRLAIVLKYIGVKDVRVLNGGLSAWQKEGYKLEIGNVKPTPIENFGSKTPINKKLIVDVEGAKKVLADNKKENVLVDIRSYNERIGKESGYSYMDRKGRIPGSVWGNSGTSSVTLENYRNIDNTMRNADEIINMWNNLGIDSNKNLTFFCGSGWRAAEVLFYSGVIGRNGNSLYSNGWMEWSEDKNNPVEKGRE
ncbi:MAG: rhodanese-like domain-containing protein [Cetobacterium sp.]